jgi:threonine dehydrogenase-like Zn-dependent dehydrogenase
VIGCGIRGVAAALAARDAGIVWKIKVIDLYSFSLLIILGATVLITGYGEPDTGRLELARSLGLTTLDCKVEADVTIAIKRVFGGKLASVVVDLSARNPGALDQVMKELEVKLIFPK